MNKTSKIGLLRGDAVQTTRCLYWNNQATQMVTDVPSEARLSPGNWGEWTITSRQKGPQD